jgi:hypothetical protein
MHALQFAGDPAHAARHAAAFAPASCRAKGLAGLVMSWTHDELTERNWGLRA